MIGNPLRRIHLVLVLLAGLLHSACGGDPIPPAVTASVMVAVTTTGDDLDADGYTIRVGRSETAIAVSGSATVEGLEAGTYEVTLTGIAANCALIGDATQSVTVSEGEGASVAFEVECLADAAGLALTEASCSALQPAALEGMPLDVVELGSVPGQFEPPIFARMAWSGGAEVSFGLVDEDSDGLPMMVPLHPSGSLEGGEVTVRISDETSSCPPFTFTIQSLPPAPGELRALVDVAQALLDEQATLFGTTRDALLSTPASMLEPALLPLAIAQAVIDESSSDSSLRSLLDGGSPDFGPGELDFVERLLARTGLRTDLEAELADVQSAGGAAVTSGGGPALALTPGLALDCVTTLDMDAELLDQCMTLARDKAQGAASAATQDNAIFALDMAALVGGKVVAGPISSLIGFSQLYDEVVADNLPSWFTSLDVTLTPAEFLEDQAGPGDWSPAEVTAMSNGWSFEDVVTGLITDRITPDVRPIQRRLTRREKLLMKIAGAGLPADVKIVENLFQDVVERLLEALVGRGVSLGDELLNIPPLTYGPVDVTDTEWTDSRIVTGSSVVLTSHEQYEPMEPGISLLEIITAVGKFGGTSIATDHLPIEVGEIELSISPSELFLVPGQDTTLTVTVMNAANPTAVDLIDGHPVQGSATLSPGPGGVHTVTYSAPVSPDVSSPDLVAVDFIGETGARTAGAEPRSASAVIRFGGLTVTADDTCIEPGESTRFDATLPWDQDPDIVWSADAGTIDASGEYTAPLMPQTVTVTATLADDESMAASVSLQVGGCSCNVGFSVDGSQSTATDGLPGFTLTQGGTEVVGLSWTGQTAAVGVTFGDTDTGTPVPVDQTGGFPALVSGVLAGVGVFNSWADPGGDSIPGAGVTVTLTRNEGGNVLEGSAFGSVMLWNDDEPIVPFSMSFILTADESVSDATGRRCLMEG